MESYVRITALGAPTSYWVGETQTPDYVSPTPARVNEQKDICETWGGVTGFQRAAGQGFKDMLEEAHRERLYGLMTEGLEVGILTGDSSAAETNGLIPQQMACAASIVDLSSTAVTLAKIREAIRTAWTAGGDLGSYGFAITDPTTYDDVKNLLTEYITYVNPMNYNLPWGLKTYAVDGIPFIRSRKMPTGAGAKQILFVDRRYTYLAVLTDVSTELYGKVKDEQNFAIKWYGVPVNRAPEFAAIIDNIA